MGNELETIAPVSEAPPCKHVVGYYVRAPFTEDYQAGLMYQGDDADQMQDELTPFKFCPMCGASIEKL